MDRRAGTEVVSCPDRTRTRLAQRPIVFLQSREKILTYFSAVKKQLALIASHYSEGDALTSCIL